MNDRRRHVARVRALRAGLIEQGLVPPPASDSTGTKTPVSVDDPYRTWQPQDKCPDFAMNVVLEVLLVRGRSYQGDIAEEVADILDCKQGTAMAYTSGALLAFREIGWVRLVTVEKRRPVWEVIDA